MATENRGVMVYLPLELEEKVVEYCESHKIVRKDKDGNIVPSLGSGIVAYLKSSLLGDLPSTRRRNVISTGITKEDVLNLIAESNTSNAISNRLTEEELASRLEMIEQSVSSPGGLARDEVKKLIQASERQIMDAVHSLWAELTMVKAIDEQVALQTSISTISQEMATGDDSVVDNSASATTVKRDRCYSYVPKFMEIAKNWSIEDITKIQEIAFSPDKKFRSRDRLIELTKFGLGVQTGSEEHPCTPYSYKEFSRIGRALKIVFDELLSVGSP